VSADDDILVRAATAHDAAGVHAVERDAFGGEIEAALVSDLVAGEAYVPDLSLVAEQGGRVVGHVLFTRAKAGDEDAALLAPLAVAPEWQGHGVGSALAREGLKRAAAMGFGVALVLGHPDYYPRFGFAPAEPHGVMSPYPVEPSEAWMVLELAPGALARARGVVQVAEALRHEEMWRE
jgi:putative acetyltransferase